MGGDGGGEPGRIGRDRFEGVGVETPQGDERAEGGVEEFVAGGGDGLGVGEHRGQWAEVFLE